MLKVLGRISVVLAASLGPAANDARLKNEVGRWAKVIKDAGVQAKQLMVQKGRSTLFELVEPSLACLPGYIAALERGWSPDNMRDVSGEHLAAIRADAAAFIASILSQTGTVKLPDCTEIPKVPSRLRWIWDGEFCGQIGLRWQPGTDDLPSHVLGHIGYAVVPWKRGRGYATAALRQMLKVARGVGLDRLEITTDRGNVASCKVIEANGGRFVEEFVQPRYGEDIRLRYVIDLAADGERPV